MSTAEERTVPAVARTRADLRECRKALTGDEIAVVMTMGALHDGHATLIRQARLAAEHVIVTIFLNPLQFGPREDLSRYPRTFDTDLEICTQMGADLVFAPTPDVVYRDGDPGVRISAGPLGDVLEGQSRPGHFDGMLTVVAKLMHLTGGSAFFFGQKDAQQLLLIRRMVRDLDIPARVRRAARAVLVAEPLVLVDYLVLVHPTTLKDVPEWYRGEALLAVAGKVGTTRLIDNTPVLVGPGGGALDVFSNPDQVGPAEIR